jgi:hypothetical protein
MLLPKEKSQRKFFIRERTTKKQNNYELGEGTEILKDNGRHHTLIAKGTYYK